VRFARSREGQRLLDVDITAMIDVVFLLIVFFMTTAQFAKMTRAEVDLPEERGEQVANQSPAIVVNIQRDGRIIVDGVETTADRLARMVAAEIDRAGGEASAVNLTVRADQSLPASRLNELATRLAGLGLRGVQIATEPPAPGAEP